MTESSNRMAAVLTGALLICGGTVLQVVALVIDDQYGIKLIDPDIAKYYLGAFAAAAIFGVAGLIALTTRKLSFAAPLALGAAVVAVGEWIAFAQIRAGGISDIDEISRVVAIGLLGCGLVISGAVVGLAVPNRRVATPTPAMSEASAAVPAGWYADPTGAARVRWWDGHGWTDHVQA